jgi:hypothetical protein
MRASFAASSAFFCSAAGLAVARVYWSENRSEFCTCTASISWKSRTTFSW